MPQHAGAPRASTRPGPRRSSGHPEWFRSGARQPFRFTQWIDWHPSQSVTVLRSPSISAWQTAWARLRSKARRIMTGVEPSGMHLLTAGSRRHRSAM